MRECCRISISGAGGLHPIRKRRTPDVALRASLRSFPPFDGKELADLFAAKGWEVHGGHSVLKERSKTLEELVGGACSSLPSGR